jgi:hypothetical protein
MWVFPQKGVLGRFCPKWPDDLFGGSSRNVMDKCRVASAAWSEPLSGVILDKLANGKNTVRRFVGCIAQMRLSLHHTCDMCACTATQLEGCSSRLREIAMFSLTFSHPACIICAKLASDIRRLPITGHLPVMASILEWTGTCAVCLLDDCHRDLPVLQAA